MDTKIENINTPTEEAAFHQGLALVELIGLFAFFLNETPEGVQAKKKLEKDWQATCQTLKQKKQLKGNIFSFSQWLQTIKLKLISSTNSSTKRRPAKKTIPRRSLKFKNIN